MAWSPVTGDRGPEDPEANWRDFTRQAGVVLLFLVIAVIAYSIAGAAAAAIAVIVGLAAGLWRRAQA